MIKDINDAKRLYDTECKKIEDETEKCVSDILYHIEIAIRCKKKSLIMSTSMFQEVHENTMRKMVNLGFVVEDVKGRPTLFNMKISGWT